MLCCTGTTIGGGPCRCQYTQEDLQEAGIGPFGKCETEGCNHSRGLHIKKADKQPSQVGTPGDSEVMFIVLILKRNKRNAIVSAIPVGTAFALSETFLFTAAHNIVDKGYVYHEIGVVRTYENPVYLSDIVILNYHAHCNDLDEDWAIYKRSSSNFTHFAKICPETELPHVNGRIGIKDFPVGLVDSVTKVTLDSFRTKVSNYQVFSDSVKSNIAKYSVTSTRLETEKERAIQVVGGRVKGSCGAAYFAANGKVVAFHKESVDDGEEASTSNSFTSARSHTSYSIGLVLCRLPKFMECYCRDISKDFSI